MKIGEVYNTYSAKLHDLSCHKRELQKRQKNLDGKADKKDEYDTVTFELDKVNEQYDALQEFMNRLYLYRETLKNAKVLNRNREASAAAVEDEAKCFETARRIARGGKVPPKDVKKLMEKYPELYMQAMHAAMMIKYKSNEKYKSLWDEDDEVKTETVDYEEINDMECGIEAPDIDLGTGDSIV